MVFLLKVSGGLPALPLLKRRTGGSGFDSPRRLFWAFSFGLFLLPAPFIQSFSFQFFQSTFSHSRHSLAMDLISRIQSEGAPPPTSRGMTSPKKAEVRAINPPTTSPEMTKTTRRVDPRDWPKASTTRGKPRARTTPPMIPVTAMALPPPKETLAWALSVFFVSSFIASSLKFTCLSSPVVRRAQRLAQGFQGVTAPASRRIQ